MLTIWPATLLSVAVSPVHVTSGMCREASSMFGTRKPSSLLPCIRRLRQRYVDIRISPDSMHAFYWLLHFNCHARQKQSVESQCMVKVNEQQLTHPGTSLISLYTQTQFISCCLNSVCSSSVSIAFDCTLISHYYLLLLQAKKRGMTSHNATLPPPLSLFVTLDPSPSGMTYFWTAPYFQILSLFWHFYAIKRLLSFTAATNGACCHNWRP